MRNRLLGRALLFLLVSSATLAVWHARNGIAAGYWGFSTQLDRAAYLIAGAPILEMREGISYKQARETLLEELGARDLAAAQVPVETHATMRQRGLSSLLEAPWTVLRHHLRGVPVSVLDPGFGGARRLLGEPPTGLMLVAFEHGFVTAARRLVSLPPYLLAVMAGFAALHLVNLCLATVGLAGCLKRKRRPTLLLVVIALYFVLASGGPHATSRYRVPVTPLVAIVAGVGAGQLIDYRRKRAPAPAVVRLRGSTAAPADRPEERRP